MRSLSYRNLPIVVKAAIDSVDGNIGNFDPYMYHKHYSSTYRQWIDELKELNVYTLELEQELFCVMIGEENV